MPNKKIGSKDLHIKLTPEATMRLEDMRQNGKNISTIINELILSGAVLHINDSQKLNTELAYLRRDMNQAHRMFTDDLEAVKMSSDTLKAKLDNTYSHIPEQAIVKVVEWHVANAEAVFDNIIANEKRFMNSVNMQIDNTLSPNRFMDTEEKQ